MVLAWSSVLPQALGSFFVCQLGSSFRVSLVPSPCQAVMEHLSHAPAPGAGHHSATVIAIQPKKTAARGSGLRRLMGAFSLPGGNELPRSKSVPDEP